MADIMGVKLLAKIGHKHDEEQKQKNYDDNTALRSGNDLKSGSMRRSSSSSSSFANFSSQWGQDMFVWHSFFREGGEEEWEYANRRSLSSDYFRQGVRGVGGWHGWEVCSGDRGRPFFPDSGAEAPRLEFKGGGSTVPEQPEGMGPAGDLLDILGL